MALLVKPDFTYIWASGGDIVEPTDLKKQQGWIAEVPPFQYENWIQNRQDQYIAHLNQRGIPAWDGLTEYEAGGLSYVQGSNGIIYQSVAASGPATTVQDPTTDVSDTYWKSAFVIPGETYTKAESDARYLQKSNNLSDVASTITARSNLGVYSTAEVDAAISAAIPDTSTDGISGSSSNLKASATGTNATVTVTADAICVKNASNQQRVLNTLSLTINSAGSGANGLDTGTIAASTWYYVWAIYNPDTDTTAGLLSLSPTAPTLPVGYTYKALCSVIRTDATGNKYPISFHQAGNMWRYKVAAGSNLTANSPLVASGVNGDPTVPTYVAVSLVNYVPAIAVAVTLRGYVLAASANLAVVPSPSITTVFGATLREANGATGGTAGSIAIADILLESTNIYWATNDANGRLLVDGFLLNF